VREYTCRKTNHKYIKSHLLRRFHLLHFSQPQQQSPASIFSSLTILLLSRHWIYIRRVVSINLVVNGGEKLKGWIDYEIMKLGHKEVRLSKLNNPNLKNQLVRIILICLRFGVGLSSFNFANFVRIVLIYSWKIWWFFTVQLPMFVWSLGT
jgi:hypothetical protein